MKYNVCVGYAVSRSIEVEAENYEDAIDLAFGQLDYPNISNKFEMAGEEKCFGVWDAEGNEIYGGDE